MGVWDTIKGTAGEIGTGLGHAGSTIADGASSVGHTIADGASWLGHEAVQIGTGISDGARAVGNAAYHGLTDWHFEGRDARNGTAPNQADLPSAPGAPNAGGWQQLPPAMSVFHDNGVGAPERKYINADGRESVKDGDTGAEVSDPRYKATYNYVNPMTWDNAHGAAGVGEFAARNTGHFFADVLPYLIGGNVRGPG